MRDFLQTADLIDPVRAAFGSDRRPLAVTRLEGGTAKGVYRVAVNDGSTVLAYRWHPDENFWPARSAIDDGPFEQDPGRASFVARNRQLTALGVRVPTLFHVDESTDIALVEDLTGGTLEALIERDEDAGQVALEKLSAMLHRMHSHTAAVPGPPTEHFITARGRRSLVTAAARLPRIGAVEEQLAYELSERSEAVQPRAEHGLIHGELGPDHVMLDAAGEPVLIDIEGTMFFDVEWEHAFLELRFGPHYPMLRTVPLDPARLQLSRLVEYLSLVAGPLTLLDGDFPHRELMREIAEGNADRALACLGGGSPF